MLLTDRQLPGSAACAVVAAIREAGRVWMLPLTLEPTRLISTIHGQRQERALICDDEFWALARLHFGIETPV